MVETNLCNIELDGETILQKIIDVRTKTINIVTEQAQTFQQALCESLRS
jgi:hypothetical protein